MNQGTKTNDPIQKLQEIFQPQQQAESTRLPRHVATRVPGRAATRVELPTLDVNEIETIIMKRYNNTVQRGEATLYFDNKSFTLCAMIMKSMRRSVLDNLTNTDALTQIEIERDRSPDYQRDYKEKI